VRKLIPRLQGIPGVFLKANRPTSRGTTPGRLCRPTTPNRATGRPTRARNEQPYLNGRERCIIEGRLALNGSTKAVTLDELADQFGISRGQVQQIERRAAMKLHRAVA
jgi:Sigma-70, region 4